MILPSALPQTKVKQVLLFGCLVLFLIAIAMVLVPALPQAIYDMVLTMTVEKPASDSGQQRLFWAMQGLKGFVDSYGLGIGPGSFRSSSMIMAIIGSMGIIGILSFLLYLKAVFQPLRKSSWGEGADEIQTLGGGLASAALLGLIPQAVGSPQPAPAAIFSIVAGAALALRPVPSRRRASRSRPEEDEADNEQPVGEPA
jgi:hypothetical protein